MSAADSNWNGIIKEDMADAATYQVFMFVNETKSTTLIIEDSRLKQIKLKVEKEPLRCDIYDSRC